MLTCAQVAGRRRRAPSVPPGLVPHVVGELTGQSAAPWVVSRNSLTSTGTAVYELGPAGGQARAVLRVSAIEPLLERETRILGELDAARLDPPTRAVLPRRLLSGTFEGRAFVVDSRLPGRTADRAVAAGDWHRFSAQALEVIESLHRQLARPMTVGPALLERWVDEPLDVLARRVARWPGPGHRTRLARLRQRLRAELSGRTVSASLIHGDFWAGNVLVDDRTGALTGIVDWDQAAHAELPVHDYLHLTVFRRCTVSHRDLGSVVRAVLRGREQLSGEERAALARAAWSFAEGSPPAETVLLLYWLRHVAAISQTQRRYASHSVVLWELVNLHSVLSTV